MDYLNIINQLRALVANQLKISTDKISNNISINSYGVSSLTVVFILQEINSQFSVDIDIQTIVDNFTIEDIARLIIKNQAPTYSVERY